MSGKFALVIANTEYNDPSLAQLSAPGKDAEDFARVLRDKEIGAFDDVNILLNHSSSAVNEAIDEFFDEKKPDDLLVLYFSGHGVRDELGSLYLAVKNTIHTRLRSTAIKSDYIRDVMDQSRSKRQVLILDCCNSGAFAQGTKAFTGGSIGTASAFEGGYGRIILTASDSTQFAWEGDKVIGETDNSLFTHYLVEGLEGEADLDGDGRITVDELYDYAYEKVRFATPKQTPSKFSSKQQGEIVLRQSTRIENIKPLPLSAELIDEIEDTRPYVREAAVQKLEKILKGKNIGLARSAKDALEKIAADDNTTRRVAQVATQVLESIRQMEQKAEEERKVREEAERLAMLKVEEERLAREKAEAERRAKEEAERLAAQKVRDEKRLAKQKENIEQKSKEDADRLAAQKAEKEELEKQKIEEEDRIVHEKIETQRKAKEEAEKLLAEQIAEEERKAREEENRKAILKAEDERLGRKKAEEDRKAREEAERLAMLKAEKERLAAEKGDVERLLAVQKATAEERIANAKIEAERLVEEKRPATEKADAARKLNNLKSVSPVNLKSTGSKIIFAAIGAIVLLISISIFLPELVFLSSNSVSEQETSYPIVQSIDIKDIDYEATSFFINGILIEIEAKTTTSLKNQPSEVIVYFQDDNNNNLTAYRSFTTLISPYIAEDNTISVYADVEPSHDKTILNVKLFMPYLALMAGGPLDDGTTLKFFAEIHSKGDNFPSYRSEVISFTYTK